MEGGARTRSTLEEKGQVNAVNTSLRTQATPPFECVYVGNLNRRKKEVGLTGEAESGLSAG